MSKFIQKAGFVFRFRVRQKLFAYARRVWLSFLGMKIGKHTYLPKMYITWPHKTSLGNNCIVEPLCYFKYDGIWKPGIAIRVGNRVFIGTGCEFNIKIGIEIGDDSLIASGCRFIDHDHGMQLGQVMRTQRGKGASIQIGKNVWLGCNVVVLKGVVIGDGAIVAAGSVVTKSIPADEIWAGVPAKKIAERTSN